MWNNQNLYNVMWRNVDLSDGNEVFHVYIGFEPCRRSPKLDVILCNERREMRS